VDKVEVSNHLVRKSDTVLKSITASIHQASDTIAQISNATSEQSLGLDEISSAMHNVDAGVQRNSQMVGDNFSLSGSLSRSAHKLVDLVGHFKL
jgi:methyl-accepting chemotaxis protein